MSASAAALAASVLLGWLTAPLIGLAILLATCAVAVIAYLRAENPDRPARLREAERSPHPHGASAGTRRVLVVANDALAGDELAELIAPAGQRVELDVLAPVLSSRVHSAVSDIDSEIASAKARLRRSLAWAHVRNIPAHGRVGDPDPTTAIEDELREFGPHEVIVITRARDRKSRQERAELDRLRRELEIPVTQVAVAQGAPAAAGRT